MNGQALFPGCANDFVDVRRLHEPEAGDDPEETLCAITDLYALFGGNMPAGSNR